MKLFTDAEKHTGNNYKCTATPKCRTIYDNYCLKIYSFGWKKNNALRSQWRTYWLTGASKQHQYRTRTKISTLSMLRLDAVFYRLLSSVSFISIHNKILHTYPISDFSGRAHLGNEFVWKVNFFSPQKPWWIKKTTGKSASGCPKYYKLDAGLFQ